MHDSDLVESIAGDRSGGLTEAYDKYCLASLGEPAEAADAVQDTFVIAAARLADLREPDRLRAWLYALARNQCQRIAQPGRPEFASAQAQFVMAGAPKVDAEEAERARLRELERENRELRMKADFLSKAAAYFAAEHR